MIHPPKSIDEIYKGPVKLRKLTQREQPISYGVLNPSVGQLRWVFTNFKLWMVNFPI